MTDKYVNHTCMNEHIYRSFYMARSHYEQNISLEEAFCECSELSIYNTYSTEIT